MSMRQDNQTVITLRPSVWQFFINELPMLLLCICALAVGGLPDAGIGKIAMITSGVLWLSPSSSLQGIVQASLLSALASFVITLCLLYRFIYLRNIRYHIGSEQIICEHGIFQRSVNYMELYRVVDFAEHQTLMQQICGLKSVTIFSMDRSTPRLELTGMANKRDIVSHIRQRVEINKRRKGVYEITNR